MRQLLFLLLLTSLLSTGTLFSQSYHATHGSPFAGSIGRYNNPASPVLGAYAWEVAPIGVQLSVASNNLYVDTTKIRVRPGLLQHYVHGNLDIGLMNFMVKGSPRMAISAGIRARTYNHYRTQPANIVDTTTSLFSFLQDNRLTPNIGGQILHQGWLQGDINLSRILFSNSSGVLSAGVTLQLMKGLSGGYFNLRQVTYQESITPPDTTYIFSGGSGRFGLSSVYDPANNIASFRDVMKQANSSLGLSIGAEYIHYTADAVDEEDDKKKRLQYNWKLGLSLIDLGANRFQYAAYSRGWENLNHPISDESVENKFTGASGLSELVDSISTLFTTINPATGLFRVSLPTRLIINFDKRIYGGIYVNTNLSLNLFSDATPHKWRTNDNNLLAITPRWEKRALGFFLPIQLTHQGHFWLGAAVKLGPLTVGLHSLELTKALAREPNLRGGGYLLFSIHPFGKKKVSNNLECWEN